MRKVLKQRHMMMRLLEVLVMLGVGTMVGGAPVHCIWKALREK